MPFDTAAYLAASQAGNNWMGSGISSAGNSIAGGIRDFKQEKKEDTAAKAIYEALAPQPGADGSVTGHPFGVTKDQLDGMSRSDRVAYVHGQVQSLAVKQHMAQLAQEQAAYQDQQQQRAAGVKFINNLAQPGAAPGPVDPEAGVPLSAPGPARFDPQSFMRAASKAGYRLEPKEMVQWMRENAADAGSETPVGWTSPAGNPYVKYHHTLTADRAPFDLSQYAGSVPNGWTAAPDGRGGVRYLQAEKEAQPKPLPSAFYTGQKDLVDQLNRHQANAALSDDELKAKNYIAGDTPTAKRATIAKALTNAAAKLTGHYETFQKQGYATPEVFDTLYAQHGLTPPGAAAGAAPASGGRVTVTKGGKQYTIPASQLEDAKKQGYTPN